MPHYRQRRQWRSDEFTLAQCKGKCNEFPDTCSGIEFETYDGTSDCIMLRGEERTVKWSPAGLHFGDEVDLEAFAAGCVVDGFPEGCDPSQQREALRDALSQHIHGLVSDNYKGLEGKLNDKIPP